MLTNKGRIVAAVVAMIVAAIFLTQYTVPGIVSQRIEEGIVHSFPQGATARVRVASQPAIALLLGRFDRLDLEINRAQIDEGLTVEVISIQGSGVRLDMSALLSGEGVRVASARDLTTRLHITEANLNQYFWTHAPDATNFRVTLNDGRANFQGHITLLGREVEVTGSGHFRIEKPATVLFVPDELRVANANVPQGILDAFKDQWSMGVDFSRSVIPMTVDRVQATGGTLIISGTYRPEQAR